MITHPNLTINPPQSSKTVVDRLETSLAREQNSFQVVRPKELRIETDFEKPRRVEDTLYVEFEDEDPRNPACFPRSKKWAITFLACYSTIIAASSSSAYSMGFASMMRDLNCTEFQATIGLSVYMLGFALIPLVSSSFSEEFGRQPLYIVSVVVFVAMDLLIALAKNIQTVIIARFIQGSFGSTWVTMVGGTIADIWMPHERGVPMSIFSFAALGGIGLGPAVAAFIEMNPKLEWRWVQGIQIILCGVYSLVFPLVMRETRSSILLTRLARKMRKETGDLRYRARIEDERASLSTLIFVSCTRPMVLLLTEPLVFSFSLWIGFLWGVVFCMVDSVPGLFQDLHHFNVGQEGTVFLSLVIGVALGLGSNFYQEHLYHKHFERRGPEARLIMACAAGVVLPISMFIYAWCAFPSISWIPLVVALILFAWATFVVYVAVFSYLADCYGPFASSALAGQSLLRNLLAAMFPLFTKQMFAGLGYNWANTMFGLIAAAMMPIPFVLFFYGPAIRRRSKLSRKIVEHEH